MRPAIMQIELCEMQGADQAARIDESFGQRGDGMRASIIGDMDPPALPRCA